MREPGSANKQMFVKTLARRLLGESNSSVAYILCKKCGKPGHLPAVFRSSGKIVEAANARAATRSDFSEMLRFLTILPMNRPVFIVEKASEIFFYGLFVCMNDAALCVFVYVCVLNSTVAVGRPCCEARVMHDVCR